jgi:Co/Zn/Cd efflux system component
MHGSLMIWVALVAVLMNTLLTIAISGDAKKSLNSKAAYIDTAGDALSSFAAVVAGLIVHYTRRPYADSSQLFMSKTLTPRTRACWRSLDTTARPTS